MYIENLFGKLKMSFRYPIPTPPRSILSASRLASREHALAALPAARQGGHKNVVNHLLLLVYYYLRRTRTGNRSPHP